MSDDLIERFAAHWGADPAAMRSTARPKSHLRYTITGGEGKDPDAYGGEIQAIRLLFNGRWGNYVFQLMNLFHVAETLGATSVFISETDVFPVKPVNIKEISISPRGLPVDAESYCLTGVFFNASPLGRIMQDLTPERRVYLVDTYIRPLMTDVQPKPGAIGTDDLVVHIRSGDAFEDPEGQGASGGAGPIYVQPPLAFYLSVIERAFGGARGTVHIVAENARNPVIPALVASLDQARIGLVLRLNNSLISDLECMLAARRLVVANGSIGIAAILMSKVLQEAYFFRDKGTGTMLPIAHYVGDQIRKHIVFDADSSYIAAGQWRNTAEQRRIMCEFPAAKLTWQEPPSGPTLQIPPVSSSPERPGGPASKPAAHRRQRAAPSAGQPRTAVERRTSISDADNYRTVCKLAVEHDLCFQAFRRHPAYALVDGLHPGLGQEYIDIALRADPSIVSHLPDFRRSDDVGGPILYQVAGIGRFSPSTLRYIKVAVDLKLMFGSLDGMRIAEIGGGYGGQCRALHVLNRGIESYTIYDLPEPMALARRFLTTLGLGNVKFQDLQTAKPISYDLVISNYAFGELTKETQDTYLDRVITGSTRGYVIYNALAFESVHPGFTYTKQEILQRIPEAKVVEAPHMPAPDGRVGNVLIYWGNVNDVPRPSVNIALNKPATQSSVSQWSTADDAQGAVNGMITGSFGFCTAKESRPWWQVDLLQLTPLKEIIVFNRIDACAPRAYSFVIKLGDEAGSFRQVHAQNGRPFGGKDGSPARIHLDGALARFVRIELTTDDYLHLDEVEVYAAP
jgi:hypothetical protein